MAIHFESSIELNKWVAEQSGGVCLLSFSGGKDSIGAWLQLRGHFERIVPVFMYLIPGLSFVDEAIAYYEEWFGVHIVRMPHPSLYRWFNNMTFTPPERCAVIEELRLPNFDYDDVFAIVKQGHNLPDQTYTAIGVRATDSLNRWTSVKNHGAVNEKRRTFYPIYDWSKDQLLNSIKSAGLRLGVEYKLFGRSFDGLDYRFLKPIADQYPEDYRRILEFFPLAELELKRMEYREDYYA